MFCLIFFGIKPYDNFLLDKRDGDSLLVCKASPDWLS